MKLKFLFEEPSIFVTDDNNSRIMLPVRIKQAYWHLCTARMNVVHNVTEFKSVVKCKETEGYIRRKYYVFIAY
jgi:hypothetical protein